MNTSSIATRANGQRILASWFNLLRGLLDIAVDYKIVATESIAASGSITVDDTVKQIRKVAGDAGAQTASTTPFGTTSSNFVDGMEISVVGTSDTNTLSITVNDIQYGVLSPVGDVTLLNNFIVTYIYDATAERFIEKSRNH